jgi:hypothetical protein
MYRTRITNYCTYDFASFLGNVHTVSKRTQNSRRAYLDKFMQEGNRSRRNIEGVWKCYSDPKVRNFFTKQQSNRNKKMQITQKSHSQKTNTHTHTYTHNAHTTKTHHKIQTQHTHPIRGLLCLAQWYSSPKL